MQSEQANLRRQYDELCTTNFTAALDVSAVRQMEKLEHVIQHLNAAQRSLSNELVITGHPITDSTSPKGGTNAALKLIDVELLERDILHVRRMSQKPSSEPQNHTTSITDAEEL